MPFLRFIGFSIVRAWQGFWRNAMMSLAATATVILMLVLLSALFILVLAAFVGNEVVSKVPTMLHTPLMSGANAVHGVIVVGAMLVAATAGGAVAIILALLAVTLGTINVVGGFVVTDRMLEMFKKRPSEQTRDRG